jgi:hypothetical protein
MDYGLSLEDVERLRTAWEIQAATLELPRDQNSWMIGTAWIAEQRAQRRKPD